MIEEVIGEPAFFVHQGPIIIHSSDHPTDLGIGAAHPSRHGISVFRALSSNPEDISATLKLYPTSHHLSSTEFARLGGAMKSFDLRSKEILFVRGAVKMEISLPAGGSLVWKGFSEDPWGSDLPSSSEAFAFMRIYSKPTPWRAGSASAG
ncbi:hypothetical protein PENSUB_6192 [Penicillium subrubescens]|uniref:Uncharacterized protein n=2 Tax=Penicillium subrubescens TaxID=1316194 RepID=A0A1Q5U328_9EURO|nr:hypothetical protein PENSUB_6192 [Penicillium subrubescens]